MAVGNAVKEDEGIWEVRGGQQHFVYSKLMCWVAIDRGLRLAERRSLPANRARWSAVRDEIYEEIMDRGWNPQRQAFVQQYDSDHLDASNLLMPLVSFVSPKDPRMLSTLDAINRSPQAGGLVSNGLVYRYDVERSADGLIGEEGSFSICTFWLVEALARAGRVEQARLTFEQMLSYANHLGLYAEQIGNTGEALGNFPQAFTHLALIRAAVNLDQAHGRQRGAALGRRGGQAHQGHDAGSGRRACDRPGEREPDPPDGRSGGPGAWPPHDCRSR